MTLQMTYLSCSTMLSGYMHRTHSRLLVQPLRSTRRSDNLSGQYHQKIGHNQSSSMVLVR